MLREKEKELKRAITFTYYNVLNSPDEDIWTKIVR